MGCLQQLTRFAGQPFPIRIVHILARSNCLGPHHPSSRLIVHETRETRILLCKGCEWVYTLCPLQPT